MLTITKRVIQEAKVSNFSDREPWKDGDVVQRKRSRRRGWVGFVVCVLADPRASRVCPNTPSVTKSRR